jgi:hypothetical protein
MKNNIYINILTPFKDETFIRQLPSSLADEGFIFSENNDEDRVWDMLIVYEGLKYPKDIKCKQGGLVFISGEPPVSMAYSSFFLNQFDHLITSHSKIKHKNNHLIQQSLPWHIGISHKSKCVNSDYKDLKNLSLPIKKKKISIISSNKLMMPGHRQRMKFLTALQAKFKNEIDIFGHGINPIDDKATALLDYQFNICIENCSINNYWTEKIADPFLGFCIPIYHGCKNIDSYFDVNSIVKIDINNIDKSIEIIETILMNSDEIYTEKFEKLIVSRDKILNEFNLFNMLKFFYLDNLHNFNSNQKLYKLRSINDYKDQKIKIYLLRFKRFLKRYL